MSDDVLHAVSWTMEMVDDGVVRGLRSRRALGLISRWMPGSAGFGRCGCCGMSWSVCDGHCTPYGVGRGCFPLCTWCWPRMGRKRRLPYYRELWEDWGDRSDLPWEIVERAVAAEPGRQRT